MKWKETLNRTSREVWMYSLCYILVDKIKKLDAKSHACIMEGYYDESKEYKLSNPIKKCFICRRDVAFDEQDLGFSLLIYSNGLSSSDSFEIFYNFGSTNYYTPPIDMLVGLLTKWLTCVTSLTCNQPSTT
jgi:hypothetical protein